MYEEGIYQNSDGEFFLRTEANQGTNNNIILLSEDKAKIPVAHYGIAIEYETQFGLVEDYLI